MFHLTTHPLLEFSPSDSSAKANVLRWIRGVEIATVSLADIIAELATFGKYLT